MPVTEAGLEEAPMNVRAFCTVALVAMPVFLIAGCGDNAGSGTSASGSPTTTLNVTETEFKLDPADPSVDKTGTVQIKIANDGKVAHALEVEGPGGEAKSDTIAPGKTGTLDVDLSKSGTYEWYCPIDGHKDKGMKGEIKVAGGGSGGSSSDDKKSSGGGY